MTPRSPTTSTDPRAASVTPQSRRLVWGALAVVAFIFLVRLPGVVQPLGPDQGVYATIGWAMGRGFALYRDLFELKPPGIYLTYWLTFAALGTKASSIFWMDYAAAALTTLVLFDLCRRLVSARFGALAAAVFAIGTLPAARYAYGGFLERAINETFISLLVSAAAWATVVAVTRWQDRWSLLAGVFAGMAAVFKPMAGVYWLALVAWVWLQAGRQRTRRFFWYSAAGAMLAPTMAIAWMWATGILPDAWIDLAVYNRAYLSIGDPSLFKLVNQLAHEVWRRIKTDEVWALGALGAILALAAWRTRRAGAAPAWLAGIWLGASLLSVVLNGPRMFQTYFMPALVPLCLLAAWVFERAFAPRRWRLVSAPLAIGFTALMLARSGSVQRAADVTGADLRQWAGRSDRQEYLTRFQSHPTQAFSAADSERLAAYLRAHTGPDERIFIFGMTASAYFLSERLPASKFLFAYPATSNMGGRSEFRVETLANELARTAPRYIVLQRHNADSYSGWRADEAFAAPPMVDLLQKYQQETDIGDYALYRKN